MDKHNFFKILCSYTPEELNELISSKGKKKMVNAITFLSDDYINEQQKYSDKDNETT